MIPVTPTIAIDERHLDGVLAFHAPDRHLHAEFRLLLHGLNRIQLRRIRRQPRRDRLVRRAGPRRPQARHRHRRPFSHAAPPEWRDPTPPGKRLARPDDWPASRGAHVRFGAEIQPEGWTTN